MLVQSRGYEIVEIHPGDVVHAQPDEEHWHGAALHHFMTHISMTEGIPGDERPDAIWSAHVTEAEYRGE